MKKRIAFILLLDLLAVFVICSSGFYDDWSLVRALSEWSRNPTTETRAALDRQSRISQLKVFAFMGTAFVFLAFLTVPTVIIFERRKASRLARTE